eukprot:g1873.t1
MARYERLPLSAAGEVKDGGDDGMGVAAAAGVVPDLPLDHFVLVHVPRDALPAQAAVKLPLQIETFPSATVGELKLLITSALPSGALPAERQRLAFNGRVLGDDCALLSACGVGSGAHIHVFPRAAAGVAAATPAPQGASMDCPVVSGVIVSSQGSAPVARQSAVAGERGSQRFRAVELRDHLIAWAFRVRIFALLCFFFFGIGLISNMAYWMGDRDIPDDREIVGVDDTASNTVTAIYTLDFMSNFLGILAASVGMKAVRLASVRLAQRHVRLVLLLILVSVCQLCTEIYSFSERYRVYASARGGVTTDHPAEGHASNSTAVPRNDDGEHVVTSKKFDELIMMVCVNVLVRVLFWSLLLRTAKKYLETLVAFHLAQREFERGSQRPEAQPQVPMVLGVPAPVATAAEEDPRLV